MVAVLKAGHSAKVDTRALYWKKNPHFIIIFFFFVLFVHESEDFLLANKEEVSIVRNLSRWSRKKHSDASELK